jgi:hypothetical protein
VKKILITAAALALMLVPLSLGAQTAAAAEFQYLSFDIGYAPGWDFGGNGGNGERITPSLFGFNIRLTDKLSAGIQILDDGTDTDKFLMLKYSFLPKVRATAGFGTQGATPVAASSLGFEIIPFTRSVGGFASTEFKVAVKYDAQFANRTAGKILFALAFGIGF